MNNKNYKIIVFGCQMNKSDGERIDAIMNKMGLSLTENEDKANIIIIVACSVRQKAIDRVSGLAYKWQKKRKAGKLQTVLTGCVAKADKIKLNDKFDLILDINDIADLPKLLANMKPLNIKDYFHIDPKNSSNFQAYVPIMTGCNNYCSYCIVPYTRGREKSRPAKDILKECRKLIKNGYKEITLLGQNVNSYKDINYNFPDLLKKIDNIKGDYWLRFVTAHPKDFSNKLIKVVEQGKHITPYVHLPVQSGSDAVLNKMNRKYTVKEYTLIVSKLKKANPSISISTDIIVGFPKESKKDFYNTATLLKNIEYDMAYIARYSPRPHTMASNIKDNVPACEKKKREQTLNEILKKTALKNNEKYIGKIVKVLVEKKNKNNFIGKTYTFKTVIFSSNEKEIVGEFVDIIIDRAEAFGLYGRKIKGKVVVILGPTSSGKTKMAVSLADKYNGEIISADSRQVYKGMDLGTGKDLNEYEIIRNGKIKKINHHLIDIVSPMTDFNVAKYQKRAYQAIDDVLSRHKLPIVVGGSGLYIDAVADGYIFPPAGKKHIRKSLEKKSLKKLLFELKKVDLKKYNEIDKKNKRRVIRALEIAYASRFNKNNDQKNIKPPYDFLMSGIVVDRKELYSRIEKRLYQRIKAGLLDEIKDLKKAGVTWKRFEQLGLEYRMLAKYLRGYISYTEAKTELAKQIRHFAKRQMTWFRRRRDIIWIEKYNDLNAVVKKFLQ